jgi:hypothetical protein
MPSNNSTQTDSIFLNTNVVHARTGVTAAVPLNFGFQPFFGVGFRNITVSDVVESGIETSCIPFNYDEMLERPSILVLEGHSTCDSPPTGYAVVEDAVFNNAVQMMVNWKPDHRRCNQTIPTNNMRLSSFVVKNITSRNVDGGNGSGVISDDPMLGVEVSQIMHSHALFFSCRCRR